MVSRGILLSVDQHSHWHRSLPHLPNIIPILSFPHPYPTANQVPGFHDRLLCTSSLWLVLRIVWQATMIRSLGLWLVGTRIQFIGHLCIYVPTMISDQVFSYSHTWYTVLIIRKTPKTRSSRKIAKRWLLIVEDAWDALPKTEDSDAKQRPQKDIFFKDEDTKDAFPETKTPKTTLLFSWWGCAMKWVVCLGFCQEFFCIAA